MSVSNSISSPPLKVIDAANFEVPDFTTPDYIGGKHVTCYAGAIKNHQLFPLGLLSTNIEDTIPVDHSSPQCLCSDKN